MMEASAARGAGAPDHAGPFDARYRAFLETIRELRPSLHRYCARMLGSVMDGEDAVQEALFEAWRKLGQYDETRPLKPWLFRIAHNRCIDLLRRRGVRAEAETVALEPDAVEPAEPAVLGVGRAVERLVIGLPPMERACVLLKDVFDYSLEEVAELVGSTVGGVKAALSRGRTKLATAPVPVRPARRADPEFRNLLQLYVDRFNRRDWEGVRALVSADARLTVADAFAGRFADAPYFWNYEHWPVPWRLALGEVDGEPVVVILHGGPGAWTPSAAIRMSVAGRRIERMTDYLHCPWVVAIADVSLAESA